MAEKKCDNKAVLTAIRTEENWAEIGRRHNISRERVRRIAAAHGLKKRINFEDALALVQPFLEHANKEACWRCGAEIEAHRRGQKFCAQCLKLRDAIWRTKYYLRTFIATGSHYSLAQAAYTIRKSGLVPDDLIRIAPEGRDKKRDGRRRMSLFPISGGPPLKD